MALVVASAGLVAAVATTSQAHGQTTATQATTAQATTTQATTAHASQTTQGTMRVLVMGDSYSAGNGAGDYSGAAGCYRSSRNYAQDFAAILRSKAYAQPTSVTNVACSGAVTADFFNPRSGRPPEISYVNSSYDVIFLTIGGNDVKFSDVVTGCLIKGLRDGATCASKLSYAETLLANGTMRTRITNVLKAIRAKANPLAKIVLLGYPFLEGDTGYTLLAGKTVVHVGQRLHAIGVAGDALDQSIVSTLNAATADRPFTFVSVHTLYDGPPYHGLYATRSNPNRWMVQPPTEIHGSTAIRQTWYHPNPTGWLEESKLLAATASVPKHPLTGPVIAPTTLPAGYVGRRYVALLSTADGRSGRWRLAGSLPAGLRLDGADIVGTPARPQDVSFRAGFTDSYGDSATAAITLDVRPRVSGTVAAFGNNGLGELGNGQVNCMSETLTRIPGLSGVTAVAADADTSYALTATGAVWAWGADGDGQLGNGTVDGTSIGQPTPTLISGLPKIVAISAGQFDGYALDAGGNVWAWGDGAFGELGMGASVYQRDRPAKIPGLAGVTQISAGAEVAYALKADGTVWAWGSGTWGALGNGSESGAAATVPKRIAGLTGITQIAAGSNYDGYALKSDGAVWAWGGNYNGEIGNGTTTDALAPVRVKDLPAVTSISAGLAAAHAITAAGTIYGWGYRGSIGTGQTADAKLPVAVTGYPGMTAVEGATAVFGIMKDGTLMAWGPPFAPPGIVVEPVNPYVVNGASDVVAAASGEAGYALKSDGTVWTWGSNYSSELGQGATCASRVPVTVRGVSAVTSLAAGGGKAVVARTDGTVWTWGWNWPLDAYGADSSMTPVQVAGLAGVTAVAAGGSTDYALRSNGTVWAWGGGASGQLGDGATTTDAVTPQQVKGLANIVQIAAGGGAGYALRSDGTVWAWGYGYDGQLGNGRRYTSGCYCSATPVQVRGVTTAVQVAGGGLAGYALLNNGTIRAWGNNSDGVLGNRSTTSSDTPVTVAGIGTASAISAGTAAGYAVLANGSGRAWGENFADELGIGQDGQTWNSCLCYDSPLKIAGLSGGVSVAGDIDYINDPGPSGAPAGGVSAYAVSADGAGRSWGCDDTGQLGSDSYLALGPKAGRLTGLTGVVQVAGSEAAGFALVT